MHKPWHNLWQNLKLSDLILVVRLPLLYPQAQFLTAQGLHLALEQYQGQGLD